MNYQEIQDLIKLVSRSSVNEVEVEKKDFKIVIRSESKKKGKDGAEIAPMQMPFQAIPQMQAPMAAAPAPASAPAPAAPAAPATPAAATEDDDSKYITIKSPMIGTFYRRPSPDKDIFVNVGDTIKPGDVVCIIEAMKLFNEIESEVSGKVVKVLVDDSTPVEYDQPLLLIDPS